MDFKEEHVVVMFNGYAVDLFTTESGNLGITVEKEETYNKEDKHSIDIFVSPELKMHGGY